MGRVFKALFVVGAILALALDHGASLGAEGSVGGASGSTYVDTHAHLFSPVSQSLPSALSKMDQYALGRSLVRPFPFGAHQEDAQTYLELEPLVRTYPDKFAFLGGGGTLDVMIQEAVDAGRMSDELRAQVIDTARQIVAASPVGFGEMATRRAKRRKVAEIARGI